jgi:hypothetical protein
MVNRLIGIVTLKAPVYKEVAEDQSATNSAAIVVVVAAIVQALGLILGGADAVSSLLTQIVGGLLGWLIGSWVIALVARCSAATPTPVKCCASAASCAYSAWSASWRSCPRSARSSASSCWCST